jgi:hypothetical protein
VPLFKGDEAEAAMGDDRCIRLAIAHSEAEGFLPMALAFRKRPQRTQGQGQPRPRGNPVIGLWNRRARRERRYSLPQQLSRPTELAATIVYLPQAMGGPYPQRVVAELIRYRQSLLTRRHGVSELPLHPMRNGQLGQYLCQSGAVAELPGQGLGRAQ